VTSVLKAIAGVDAVSVSLSAGEATVQYDEKLTSPEKLKTAVKGAGYGVDVAAAAHVHKSKGGCCS
jgi:copper chaperone CopZ